MTARRLLLIPVLIGWATTACRPDPGKPDYPDPDPLTPGATNDDFLDGVDPWEPGEARLDHLGIQVETAGELDALAERIRGSGQPFVDVEKAHCCYAKSEKAWVRGSAGERWEAFLTHSHDEAEYGEDRGEILQSLPATGETSADCCV